MTIGPSSMKTALSAYSPVSAEASSTSDAATTLLTTSMAPGDWARASNDVANTNASVNKMVRCFMCGPSGPNAGTPRGRDEESRMRYGFALAGLLALILGAGSSSSAATAKAANYDAFGIGLLQ